MLIPRTWGLFKAIECLIELVHMVRKVGVLETRGLLNINQLMQKTIKKCTFHIHLLQHEVMMRSISKQQTNRFKASNGSKGFTLVDTLDLGVALCYQSCLVTDDNTMSILLVLEEPFGSNDIMVLLCLGTNFHTLLRSKLLSSSCMASSQSGSSSAS